MNFPLAGSCDRQDVNLFHAAVVAPFLVALAYFAKDSTLRKSVYGLAAGIAAYHLYRYSSYKRHQSKEPSSYKGMPYQNPMADYVMDPSDPALKPYAKDHAEHTKKSADLDLLDPKHNLCDGKIPPFGFVCDPATGDFHQNVQLAARY
jgi:hypothetical protein